MTENAFSQKTMHIAIIGHEDFIQFTKLYTRTYENLELSFYVCYGEKVVNLLPELEEQNIEAIICGITNSRYLSRATDIPLVICRATAFDIIAALNRARELHHHDVILSLVDFESYNISIEALSQMTGMNIIPITHTSLEELTSKLAALKQKGIYTLIGSSLSVHEGEKLGMNCQMVYNLQQATASCLQRAMELIHAAREQKKREDALTTPFEYIQEAIVQIDRFDRIMVFNHEARLLFGIPLDKNLVGKEIQQIVPDFSLTTLSEKALTSVPIMEQIHGQNTVVIRSPVMEDNQIMGAVASIMRLDYVHQLESKFSQSTNDIGFKAKYTFDNIIHTSDIVQQLIYTAKRYAQSNLPVLIEGETGTGKELFAQSIHNCSPRFKAPFIAINCASLPESLLESELFGYEAGSFTGAKKSGKKGLFELAHKGTLFLDEINSIPKNFQVKLLRAIEEKEIIRVGGDKIIPVDIRIIASTNENIPDLIKSGQFRSDLFFRISVLQLHIPPLRDRLDDIPCLVENLSHSISPASSRIASALATIIQDKLRSYPFPGNIRELRSLLERFFLLWSDNSNAPSEHISSLVDFCFGNTFQKGISPVQDSDEAQNEKSPVQDDPAEESEKDLILRLLEKYKNNKSKVASELGCGRNTLYRKLAKYQIV